MFVVHRSAHGSTLVAALAELLADPLADPFAEEVVAVPARGVERWLAQRLSHHLGAGTGGDGVCARVGFPHPDALLDGLVAAAGEQHRRATLAWQVEQTVWPLLEVLDELGPDEAWCRQVVHHLHGSEHRRWATAARLAGLFDRYAASRPELLVDWAAGRDDVPRDLAWQPELWRRLRSRLGESPAELLDAACDAVRAHPGAQPERLSLWGVTRLDARRLRVLAALAQVTDVHLWLNHPSPVLWRALEGAAGASGPTAVRRADAPTGARTGLLASLSREVRELQLRLRPDVTVHHDAGSPSPPATLLARLQDALARDEPVAGPAGSAGPAGPAGLDRSVQVHACHGRARQVEVLRELVLGLLADDPTLEPRDVLVMCPDVEAYAPLVAAAFADGGATQQLRVQVADRSPRQVNPLLAVLAALLELAHERATASQVLDLAGQPAVRRRYGLGDDDLEQLRGWAVGAGVHWGLDAAHRARWGLAELGVGTWQHGLDRLVAGVALDEDDGLLGGALPQEGVESSDVRLLGALADLVAHLRALCAELTPQPLGGWLDRLERAVDAVAEGTEPWHRVQLQRELDALRAAAGESLLSLGDVTALLERRLEGRPTSTSFRTGGLTVCTLTPMRSVPHRVVCLLGLDDGAFPRASAVDGDDVLARDPRVGERDPRAEDRQLLLDAVCAAEEVLLVTYDGADARSGATRPPAVPLGELLDALPAGVVTRHPLQPFDPRCFSASPGGDRSRSFDRAAYEGALASREPDLPVAPFLVDPLPPSAGGPPVVDLPRLVEFWESPARAFLRQRLDVALPTREEEPEDALPVELEALDAWQVGDRVLRARLHGGAPEQAWERELARGELPPGALSADLRRQVEGRVSALVAAATPYRAVPARALDVEIGLARARVTGTVTGVRGDVQLSVSYSSLRGKQRIRAWVQLLAATAAHPDLGLRAVVVGRDRDGASVWQVGPVEPVEALQRLDDLVRLRALGLRAPLLLPPDLAEGYARGALAVGKRTWTTGFGARFDNDDRRPEHVLCFGGVLTADEAVAWQRLPLSFRSLADQVWGPLLAAERGRA